MADAPPTRDERIDEMMALCNPDPEEASSPTPSAEARSFRKGRKSVRAHLANMRDHQLDSIYTGLKHLSDRGTALIESGQGRPVRDHVTSARHCIEQADAAVARFSDAAKNWPSEIRPAKPAKPR